MELATLFTEQKWNILSSLSEKPYSPLQLAEKLDTTMANISQQLRLLEAFNLVKKEKIRNRDKGKPRSLFSLVDNHAYLISSMDSFAEKKLIKVNQHQSIVLKIWYIENQELQYSTEKLYWDLIDDLDNIDFIGVDEVNSEIIIVTENKKVSDAIKIIPNAKTVSKNNLEKISNKENFHTIHDPKNIIEEK
ncbi:winged helix-turn-helix transcriptional regulator [Candidatus Woesearchaeota archaeon]|nr:winged helix-turn-helix transcriptional regulator [Candidatus Woesearchaeota archaeon]